MSFGIPLNNIALFLNSHQEKYDDEKKKEILNMAKSMSIRGGYVPVERITNLFSLNDAALLLTEFVQTEEHKKVSYQHFIKTN